MSRLYKPLSRHSSAVYEQFLLAVSGIVGDDVTHAALVDVCFEIIGILRSKSVSDPAKVQSLTDLVGYAFKSDREVFDGLLSLAQELNDYDSWKSDAEREDGEFDTALVIEQELAAGQDSTFADTATFPAEGMDAHDNSAGNDHDDDAVIIQYPRHVDFKFISALVKQDEASDEDNENIASKVIFLLSSVEDLHELGNTLAELLGYEHLHVIQFLVDNRDRLLKDLQGVGSPSGNLVTPSAAFSSISSQADIAISRNVSSLQTIVPHQLKRFAVPDGAVREFYEDYEELSFPLPNPQTAAAKQLEIVAVSDIPEWAWPAFEGVTHLNRIQSAVYSAALFGNRNILLCSPTGSGKTIVALLCILHDLGLQIHQRRPFLAVYVAPMKALVSEVCSNLKKRLESFNLRIFELSGDVPLDRSTILNSHIIITTPEKWDVVTRKQGFPLERVTTIIFDEVHLLHDTRGAVIESLVGRVSFLGFDTRLVGLSATLPNHDDVATFLKADSFVFDPSFRPCPLAMRFIGLSEKKAGRKAALLNDIALQKVFASMQEKHQTLVFVHSRKETSRFGRTVLRTCLDNEDKLALLMGFMSQDSNQILASLCAGNDIQSVDLRELLRYGIGIHHAGMTRADRALVEDLFADGRISVLVSTATLAWGVNLPAHTVIIKGTRVYDASAGDWVEMSWLDLVQMMGRAGRPQFDTSGLGVVIADSVSSMLHHAAVAHSQMPVESRLMASLHDTLSGEVASERVASVADAVRFLSFTYWSTRSTREPLRYGIGSEFISSPEASITLRSSLVRSIFRDLDECGMVEFNSASGMVKPSAIGRIASDFYLRHENVREYTAALRKLRSSDRDLLSVFGSSYEFRQIIVREEERPELLRLSQIVPIPVHDLPMQNVMKVSCLLQCYLSRIPLTGFSLSADMAYVSASAGRLLRALHSLSVAFRNGPAALCTLRWAVQVEHRLWACQCPLRQFPLSSVDVRNALSAIEKKGVPAASLFHLSEADLMDVLNAPSDVCHDIHSAIQLLPRFRLTAAVQPLSYNFFKFLLSVQCDFDIGSLMDAVPGRHAVLVNVESGSGGDILWTDVVSLGVFRRSSGKQSSSLILEMYVSTPKWPFQCFIRLSSDRFLSADSLLPITFDMIVPPRMSASLSVDQVVGAVEGALQLTSTSPGDSFLLLSSAHFRSVWKIFVVSVLQCFSLRKSESASPFRCVFLVHSENDLAAAEAFVEAEISSDLRVLKVSSATVSIDPKENLILLSTCDVWEIVQRRWRKRRAVREIDVYAIDCLEVLSPALEIVVSRARYISSLTQRPVSMYCSLLPVANIRNLLEWIGVQENRVVDMFSADQQHPRVHVVGIQTEDALLSSIAAQLNLAPDPCLIITDSFLLKMKLRAMENIQFVEDVASLSAKSHPHAVMYVANLTEVSFSLSGFDRCVVALSPFNRSAPDFAVLRRLFYGPFHSVHVFCRNVHENVLSSSFLDLPILESRLLDASMQVSPYLNVLNSEVALASVSSVPDVLELFTWSFAYRRFWLNPSFYGFLSPKLVSHISDDDLNRGMKEYLSGVVDSYCALLSENSCILGDAFEEKGELTATPLGTICSSHAVSPMTGKLLWDKLDSQSGVRTLLDLISHSGEIQAMVSRLEFIAFDADSPEHVQKHVLDLASRHLPLRVPSDASVSRVFLMMCLYLDRHELLDSRPLLTTVLCEIVGRLLPLLRASVDVCALLNLPDTCLTAMRLSQYFCQGTWVMKSAYQALLQVPHFSKDLIKLCESHSIQTPLDLADCEDDTRAQLFAELTESQQLDIAEFCNSFPSISVSHEVSTTETTQVALRLVRSLDSDETAPIVPIVHQPLSRVCPKLHEGWWVLVVDSTARKVLGVQYLLGNLQEPVEVSFALEEHSGNLVAHVVSDCYIGADVVVSIDDAAPNQ
eukprot:ANDGO_05989.mRNA.1 Putative U5 small nuclear ribonucleoprotein 200 kDa helicase